MSWTITGTEKTPVDRLGIANVSLLLHGDGANGSTTIIDSSPTPKTVTAVGDAQISTAESKFGGASLYFPGTSGSLLAVASNSAFALSSSWTIECFILRGAGNFQSILSNLLFNTVGGIGLYLEDQSVRIRLGGGTAGQLIASTTIPATWFHLAVSSSSGVVSIYIDGVSVASATISRDVVQSELRIRQLVGFNYWSECYIDELRITKGIARYTANFTPPTAPFPDV